MKTIVLLLTVILGINLVWAQTQPPGTISQPAQSSASPNPAGTASTTFTNTSGAAYSADQLAAQLRDLRSTVDRTLPVLSAYTETYSNASGNQTVAGRLENLLSGSRNRSSSQ